MDYQEAMEATVSRLEARREVEKHGADYYEFLTEVGERDMYHGSDVLGWLGY